MDYFRPDMTALDANKLSMLALAHVGDAVYELLTRTMLCTRANCSVAQLHKQTVSLVECKFYICIAHIGAKQHQYHLN